MKMMRIWNYEDSICCPHTIFGGKNMNDRFYKINEVTQHKYYQIPKELYTNPRYKTVINNDAKVLYALLLDRMELSRINNWVDDDGTIFLIFKREDLADMLGICVTTVWRAIKQLKAVGLIAEKRQGLNLPNLIYVGKIDYSVPDEESENTSEKAQKYSLPTDSEILNNRTVKKSISGDLQSESQDIENVKGNDTENINPKRNITDRNDTESKYKSDKKNYIGADSS